MCIAADNYASILSQRVSAERLVLSGRWLERLKTLLTVAPNDVFPSDQLLDHIPLLITEIAGYLRAHAEEEIAANAAVIDKARELGALRHEQRASVHQLLREYEILGEILETFLVEETALLGLQPTSTEVFDVLRRLTRSIATLMRTTVDTFISEYMATIQDQNDRIRAFHRAASHELRSPIGTILFAAGILEKDHGRLAQDEGRLARIAVSVRTSAERLGWLVENLQRMSRLSEPMDGPSRQLVEIETVANEVARQLEEMAAGRRVTIRVLPGLPVIVIDAARLELVLLNLVSNAIKYSDAGQAESFVEVAPGPPQIHPTLCSLVVRDNGLGIAEEDQATVFERFFRAHAHLDEQLGVTGTGLGLSIVAECTEALGGSIRCESSAGQGTTFFITLPATANADD